MKKRLLAILLVLTMVLSLVPPMGITASAEMLDPVSNQAGDLPHAITVDDDIDGGTVSASETSAATGTNVILTATPGTGNILLSWNVYKTDDVNTTVTVTHDSFTMPDYAVTVSATFTASSKATPLCFTANNANSSVTLKKNGTIPDGYSVKTSTDGVTWTSYTLGTQIKLTNIGDKVYFLSDTVYTENFTSSNYLQFSMSGSIAASGNVMSLRYSDYASRTAIEGDYAFYRLFYDRYQLTSAPELPATTLAPYCYDYMFLYCTYLTAAPALPATTLADHCYDSMFSSCYRLTVAPALPATTLAAYCYSSMFSSCYRLTAVPVLPATTLAAYCYKSMFYYCTDLTTAPALPADTLAPNCYDSMFSSCPNLTAAPVLPATTLAAYCYNKMFCDCPKLTDAPALPATTLADHCYDSMFSNCTSLTKSPALPATMLADYCYKSMFYYCSGLKTVSALSAATMDDHCCEYMFCGCKNLTVRAVGEGETGNLTIPDDSDVDKPVEQMFYNCRLGIGVSKTPKSGTYQLGYDPHAITVDGSISGGTVSADRETAMCGDTVTLTATPDTGNSLAGWDIFKTGDSSTKVKAMNGKFTMPDYAVTVSASFGTSVLTWTQPEHGSITVKVGAADISSGDGVTVGDAVTVTVAPDDGYILLPSFNADDGSTVTPMRDGNSYTFTMPASSVIIAADSPLCLAANNANSSVTLKKNGTIPAGYSVKTSTDGVTWTSYTLGTKITLTDIGDKVYFLSDTVYTADFDYKNNLYFSMDGSIAASGNVMSLRYSDFTTRTAIKGDYAFVDLFENCSQLTSAPELPATTLERYCYNCMFRYCSGLTVAPKLPATALAANCYGALFSNCTGLTVAPELPATTLAEDCYSTMFCRCTGLTVAPELPATTLADSCYDCMFEYCSSLVEAPALPATTLAAECYNWMFYECSNLRTAPTLSADTLVYRCYYLMFYNCTKLTVKAVGEGETGNVTIPDDSDVTNPVDYMFYSCRLGSGVSQTPEAGTYQVGYDPHAITVDSSITGGNVSADKETARFGDTVTLTATPETGSSLASWDIFKTGVSSTKVSVINGKFTMPDYAVTVSASFGTPVLTWTKPEHGSITVKVNGADFSSGNEVTVGDTVTVTVTPDDGYILLPFFNVANGSTVSPTRTGNTYTFTMPASSIDISADSPLCLTAEGTDITVTLDECGNVGNIPDGYSVKTSTDGVTWTAYELGDDITLDDIGDKVYFLSDTVYTADFDYNSYLCFSMDGSIAASGNVMSLRYSDYAARTEIVGEFAFVNLFCGCEDLTSAPELPATTLSYYCYGDMFDYCTSLVEAPALPATELTGWCYDCMFYDCYSLVAAPALPATTLAEGCYDCMFYECTSLEEAPALPATTLAAGCYWDMFYGCTSLVVAPELRASKLAENCYSEMFSGCTSLTVTVNENGNVTIPTGYDSDDYVKDMFSDCDCGSSISDTPAAGTYQVGNNTHAVTVDSSITGGTVSANKSSAASGVTVTLTATPETGKSLAGWNVYKTGDENTKVTVTNCKFTMPDYDVTVSAVFGAPVLTWTRPEYGSITVSAGGSPLTSGTEVAAGTVVTVTSKGLRLSFNAVDGSTVDVSSSGNTYTFTMPAASVAIETGNGPLCFTAVKAGSTVILNKVGSIPTGYSVKISRDYVTWTPYNLGDTITLQNVGDTVYFLSDTVYTASFSQNNALRFTMTGSIAASGNVMSLRYADYATRTAIEGDYAFAYLFGYCASLVNAPELPATTLTDNCYACMFEYCYGLTKAPALPATTLTYYCYNRMFMFCEALEEAPAMAPTKLAYSCFKEMFSCCTKLRTASALTLKVPASQWNSNSCYRMFHCCSSLPVRADENGNVTIPDGYGNDSYVDSMFWQCIKDSSISDTPAAGTYQVGYDPHAITVDSSIIGGTVSASRETALCGDVVTLTGTREEGSALVSWNVYKTGDENTKVTVMNGMFTMPDYAVTVSAVFGTPVMNWDQPEHGSITVKVGDADISDGDEVTIGATVTVTVTPDNGNVLFPVFTAVDGSIVTSTKNDNTYTFTMPASSVTITAGCSPLCFTAQKANSTVTLKENNKENAGPIPAGYSVKISTDGITWTAYTLGTKITLTNIGDKVYFLSDTVYTENFPSNGGLKFSMTGSIAASGNVMSLRYSDYTTRTAIEGKYAFVHLFHDCDSLTKAPELPATTLAPYCYSYMFADCDNLTAAPALPATTLADYCYDHMFMYCFSLSEAPALPATTLAQCCYYEMFEYCALTKAPALPATTLAQSCYSYMFSHCSSLVEAPALPATTLEWWCYSRMFYCCTALQEAPALPATTLAPYCYYEMFGYCISLKAVPALPAATMASNCYAMMFEGCSSLPVKAVGEGETGNVTIPDGYGNENYVNKMFYNCIKDSGVSETPAAGTYQVGYIPCTITVDDTISGGTVSANKASAICGVPVTLTAAPDEGYALTSWNVYKTGDSSTKITVMNGMFTMPDYDVTVSAVFGIPVLTWTQPTNGSITVKVDGADISSGAEVAVGADVTVTVTPDDGDVMLPGFSTADGSNVTPTKNGNTYSFKMPASSIDITAGFPLCLTAQKADSTVTLKKNGAIPDGYSVKTSTDGVTWTAYTLGTKITLTNIGDKVYFRSDTVYKENFTSGNYLYFSMTGSIAASGNVMSLRYSDYASRTVIEGDYAFTSLFNGCYCLTKAPALPATTLADYCYNHMFFDCTSLVVAPELKATNLTEGCYKFMFYRCTRLAVKVSESGNVTIPETDDISDYAISMFDYCSRGSGVSATPAAGTYQAGDILYNIAVDNDITDGTVSVSQKTAVRGETVVLTAVPDTGRGFISWNVYKTGDENTKVTVTNGIFTMPDYAVTVSAVFGTPVLTWTQPKNGSITVKVDDADLTSGAEVAAGTVVTFTVTSDVGDVLLPGFSTADGSTVSVTSVGNTYSFTMPASSVCIRLTRVVTSPLCLTANTAGSTVTLNEEGTIPDGYSVKISTDGVQWDEYELGDDIPLANAGDKVYFLSDNVYTGNFNYSNYLYFSMEGSIAASGNVMSLRYSDYAARTAIEGDYAFVDLFYECGGLTAAPELPATTLTYYCYADMFCECTSLEEAPALPSETLAEYCYYDMFYGCTSLVVASELKATELAEGCYQYMFEDCTRLTVTVSENGNVIIPAGYGLYEYVFYMFSGCDRGSGVSDTPAAGIYQVSSIPHDITVDSSVTGGTVTANKSSAVKGATVRLTANPDKGKGLENWNVYKTGDSSTVITVVNGKFTMPDYDVTVSAAFGTPTLTWTQPEHGSITVKVDGAGISGGAEVAIGATVTVTVTPDDGYVLFPGFNTADGSSVSPTRSGNTYSFTMPASTVTIAAGSPLCLTANTADSTVTLDRNGTIPDGYSVKISTDGVQWDEYELGDEISLVNAGDKVYFLSDNVYTGNFDSSNYLYFSMEGSIAASGNVMSLRYSDYASRTEIEGDYAFSCLFYGGSQTCTALTSAPELPATKLTEGCYYDMFEGTALTVAPTLPATEMAVECYEYMFYECISLVEAPALPASTLAYMCCESMFYKCTSLVEAPALPATELADWCYDCMFQGCTSLVEAPALPATKLAEGCYDYMFEGCTSLVEAPALPATTMMLDCYAYMFDGCTSLMEAPALPATELAEDCYEYMFRGCTSLVVAPELKATELEEGCYKEMFSGCERLTVAVSENGNVTIPTGYDSDDYVNNMFCSCDCDGSVSATPAAGTYQVGSIPHTITVDGSITGGTVTANKKSTAAGVPVTLTATPAAGNGLVSWNVCKTGDRSTKVTVRNGKFTMPCYDVTVSASFGTPVLTWTQPKNGSIAVTTLSGSLTSGAAVAVGTEVAVTVSANTGCILIPSFSTADGSTVSPTKNGDTYTFTMPSASVAIVAYSPLCFTAEEAGSTVMLNEYGTIPDGYSVKTSTDGVNWTAYSLGTEITLENIGDKVYFLSDNIYAENFDYSNNLYFSMEGSIAASGNVMSLRYSDYATRTEIAGNYAFICLFYGGNQTCKALTSAPELPATTLTEGCYEYMFCECTGLAEAPALPAAELADWCYDEMFCGCTSLVVAPELRATVLAEGCYYEMFCGCEKLTVKLSPYGNVTIPTEYGNNIDAYAEDMFSDCDRNDDVGATPAAGIYQVGKVIRAVSVDGNIIGGTVTANKETAEAGETVTLTATPESGKLFVRWNVFKTGDVNTTVTVTNDSFTMPCYDVTVSAVFVTPVLTWIQPKKGSITVSADDTDLTSGAAVAVGTEVTVTVTANTGCDLFLSFNTADGSTVSPTKNGDTYTFTMPSASVAIVAYSPLCFTAEEAGSAVMLNGYGTIPDGCSVRTSTDGVNWTAYTLGTEITLTDIGDKVYFLSDNVYAENFDYSNYLHFSMEGSIAASGNVMSLRYSDYATRTDIEGNYAFVNLFYECEGLTSAPELSATTLAEGCYACMFRGCASLIVAPELKATELTDYCYDSMFDGCSKLMVAAVATETDATWSIPYSEANYPVKKMAKDTDTGSVTVETAKNPGKYNYYKAAPKEVLTVTATADHMTYTGNAYDNGDVTISAAKSGGDAVTDLTYTYTWYAANNSATPLAGAPADIGAYKLVVSVADSDETYTGKSEAIAINILPVPVDDAHKVVSGTSAYEIGSGEEIEFISAADNTDFVKVTVSKDGGEAEQLTENEHYTRTSGSIRIALTETYIATLTPGRYVFMVYSKLPYAATETVVNVEFVVNVSRSNVSHSNVSHSTEITVSAYTVSVANAANGTVTSSAKTAASGSTVTLTVKPDKGCTLETITVKDAKGNEIELTAKEIGKVFTFRMPSSKVTVTATFMEDNTKLNFFVDVHASDYFYDAVLWAAANGITNGVDHLHFAPNAITTRVQMVTFLWRAAGSPEPVTTTSNFTDINANEYYYKAVLWAEENGITNGVTETDFAPDAAVTRGQCVTFLWRYKGSPVVSTSNIFTDVKATEYYYHAVAWAAANKITTGATATTFAPDSDCTRAQIVTLLYRDIIK